MILFLQIIAFLFTIFILVLVHEYGHFLVARFFKVKVLRFSIGFGKPIYKWRSKKSHVEFVFAPILIGGYVKLLDSREDRVSMQHLHEAFDQKPILARAAIIFAGPLTNFLLALLALWLMFILGVTVPKPVIGKILPNSLAATALIQPKYEIVNIDSYPTKSWKDVVMAIILRSGEQGKLTIYTELSPLTPLHSYQIDLSQWKTNYLQPDPLQEFGIVPYHPIAPAIIGKIISNSPAAGSLLRVGDRVLQINQSKIKNWDDLIDYIRLHPKESLNFKVVRQGERLNFVLATDWKYGKGWKKVGFIGVVPLPTPWPENLLRTLKYPGLKAFHVAMQELWKLVDFNAAIMVKLITHKISLHVLGGPLTIYQASSQAVAQGLVSFIGFLALISMTLAFINMLPLPGLDGGFIIFLLAEVIMRKPLSLRVQAFILRLGMIFLLMMFLQAIINDVMRIF